jgi:hypothetical protein
LASRIPVVLDEDIQVKRGARLRIELLELR